MSTATSTSIVIKDGKKITTKTITTTDADGKRKVETFVEEEEDVGEVGGGHDLFKNRIRELREIGVSSDDDEKREGQKKEVASSSSSDEQQGEEDDGHFTKFQLETLKAHNELRAKHGVPAVELSAKMCTYAQEWADQLLAENRFQHRRKNKYGENLYSSWSSRPKVISGEVPVESWYSEIKDYTFGQEPRGGPTTGHFSQIVWRESTHLGVGLAQKDGKIIVVGNYSPAGNIVGRHVTNVPPPM